MEMKYSTTLPKENAAKNFKEALPDKKRSHVLDAVKGAAVMLVVFGHYVPKSSPEYWQIAVLFIYTFHMSIFFILSGYFFSCSRPVTGRAGLILLLKKKFDRLMIPFFVIALLFFLLKFPAQFFFTMHNPVTEKTILLLLIDPQESYVQLLWFMETLFLMFVIYGALSIFIRNKYVLGCILCLAPLIPFPDIPIVKLVFYYFPSFSIGTMLPHILDRHYSQLHRFLFSVAAGIVMFVIFNIPESILTGPYTHLLRGLSSTVFLSLFIPLLPLTLFKVLSLVGLYGSSIYLLHFPFESGIKKIADQILFLPEQWFWFLAVPAIVLGILCPILIEQKVLIRYPRVMFAAIGERPSGKISRVAALTR